MFGSIYEEVQSNLNPRGLQKQETPSRSICPPGDWGRKAKSPGVKLQGFGETATIATEAAKHVRLEGCENRQIGKYDVGQEICL